MKPLDSIWVLRMWCGIRTDTVLMCFDDPEGLNCGDLLVSVVPGLSS
jgi:hypothetical protein